MKSFVCLVLLASMLNCKKEEVLDNTCDNFAKDAKTADAFVQGRWKLTAMYAGRAGKQPLTNSVELVFANGKVDIKVDGKTTTTQYEIYLEPSGMLRISQPLVSSAYYNEYAYFVGYLRVCESLLKTGTGPIDGYDYHYERIK